MVMGFLKLYQLHLILHMTQGTSGIYCSWKDLTICLLIFFFFLIPTFFFFFFYQASNGYSINDDKKFFNMKSCFHKMQTVEEWCCVLSCENSKDCHLSFSASFTLPSVRSAAVLTTSFVIFPWASILQSKGTWCMWHWSTKTIIIYIEGVLGYKQGYVPESAV